IRLQFNLLLGGGDAVAENLVQIKRLLGRLKRERFLLARRILLEKRQEHIAVLLVGLTVRLQIRDLLPCEAHVFHPFFRHARRLSPAQVAEQAIVVAPLRDRQRGEGLDPAFLARHPAPRVQRRQRRRKRLRSYDLLGRKTDRLSLFDDQREVAVFGELVANDFFVFVLEDALFDREHWTVSRDVRPAITAMPHEKALLRHHHRGARLVHLDSEIALERGRADVLAHHLAERFTPYGLFHYLPPACCSLSKKPSALSLSMIALS